MALSGTSLLDQWNIWRDRYAQSGRKQAYIAYLQSFSNTYGPPERLASLMSTIQSLPDVAGISIGTRPDCLDAQKLDILAASHLPETWLELGVQTSHNDTLRLINRRHDAAISAWAIKEAAARGIRVCAHVIFGLPNETPEQMLQTIHWLNDLPILGIKFHNLYVCHHTALATMHSQGAYTPLTRQAYIDILVEALCILRPDIVVHRLTGDPELSELVAPLWAAEKPDLIRDIDLAMRRPNLWQGCHATGDWLATERPLWFDNPADMSKKKLGALEQVLVELRARNRFYEVAGGKGNL